MTTFKKIAACQSSEINSSSVQELNKNNPAEQEMNDYLNNLLKSKDYLLLVFIRRNLMQFKLNHYYEEIDIILMAHDTAIKKIREGTQVRNYQAWFKRICFNKIRDLSKKKKSENNSINKLKNKSEFTSKEYSIPELSTSKNLEALFHAFNKLSEPERKILILRYDKELDWKYIGQILVNRKYEIDDKNLVGRVRKKGERALKKLRNVFFNYIQI